MAGDLTRTGSRVYAGQRTVRTLSVAVRASGGKYAVPPGLQLLRALRADGEPSTIRASPLTRAVTPEVDSRLDTADAGGVDENTITISPFPDEFSPATRLVTPEKLSLDSRPLISDCEKLVTEDV